ncbi:MAG: ATP-binding protein [Magnetococcus sp. YQC-3]
MFKKAERKQAKLRLCLTGPSGSGKTFSSLKIAGALPASGVTPKIAMIDTENRSAELYAHLVDFDVAQLTPPYHPERYIDLINSASQSGYEVLIIDSLSHGWIGEGGMLDQHQKITQSRKDHNSFAAWQDVTPMQNRLISAIMSAPLHIIATLRTKTAWEVVENVQGKKAPVKVGLTPQQREGLDYEFTVVLDLSPDGHVATASKDRTGLFDGQHFVPGMETGQKLSKWLLSGADPGVATDTLVGLFANCDSLATLKDLWRQHEPDINAHHPDDINVLKNAWLARKATLVGKLNNHPGENAHPSTN